MHPGLHAPDTHYTYKLALLRDVALVVQYIMHAGNLNTKQQLHSFACQNKDKCNRNSHHL